MNQAYLFMRPIWALLAVLLLTGCGGNSRPPDPVVPPTPGQICDYPGPYHSFESRPCLPGDSPGHERPQPCSWCDGGWWPPLTH